MNSLTKKYKHRFSVFTSSYNRGDLLRSLHDDLVNQTFKDFEWVVVNDGSDDKTDEIMHELISLGKLDINYISYPKNAGKHYAWRMALSQFKGRYVITADDDDPLLPKALQIHYEAWLKLEHEQNYDQFWEIRSRCKTPEDYLVGAPLPVPYFDSDYIEVNIKMKNKAEMVGSRKVEILRDIACIPAFIYEDQCSNFPEGLRWIRAARKFKTRFIPDVTRIYTPNPLGLCSKNKSERLLYNGLIGAIYSLKENRDLLLKYDIKDYLRNIAIIGYRAVQLNKKIKHFDLHPADMLLSNCTKVLFMILVRCHLFK